MRRRRRKGRLDEEDIIELFAELSSQAEIFCLYLEELIEATDSIQAKISTKILSFLSSFLSTILIQKHFQWNVLLRYELPECIW
jgi:hypothetical protein